MRTEKTGTSVAVVGGGAAGMMAAYFASSAGASVTVFEKNRMLGRKLRITGKGRCNLTNACGVDEFLSNVPTNPRFLYSALARVTPADVMDFFESAGVPLKTERGRRVFPVSDKAGDVADALASLLKRQGVETVREEVTGLWLEDGKLSGIESVSGKRRFDAVIIATGGLSYPLTGSTGDGYRWAKETGHKIVPQQPSLVPVEAAGSLCRQMMGLSLRNVMLTVKDTETGKTVFREQGEMLFTHFGLSGPLVLSASAHMNGMRRGRYVAHIDFKPALDEKTLDRRILQDFTKYINREFRNALGDLLPQKAIAPVIELSGIVPDRKVNSVTQKERAELIKCIKDMTITLNGFRPIAEAIVTRGGVDPAAVSPGTMESKIVPGLFFAGEILDVDAYTGGYNLQIAFATGRLAGLHAAAVNSSETGE
ncbi:MAG: NAD(P)/FAD-dependent oxidoreductase [Clostridia bacterium]|nr:NAD(P)/FAD-dependent oxidoreductase [Clostridia bacterium]